MNFYIPILMYHSIGNKINRLSVPVKSFYSQMKLMKKLGYNCINLLDLNKQNNEKKFIITFDDGYQDVYLNAYPILKEFNFTATFFIVSNLIDCTNRWDIQRKDFQEMKLMNCDQISELIEEGYEIGSHTHEHYDLTKIGLNEISNQIIKSKRFLENKFNVKVFSFSYPYGSYDNKSLNIIKNEFKFAVTTKRSRFYLNKFNDYELPRVPINAGTGLLKFIFKIKTKYEDIKFKD